MIYIFCEYLYVLFHALRQLITSHSPAHMQLHDIVYFMLFHIVGMALASIVFALELLASRLAREQSTRANHTKPECVRKY